MCVHEALQACIKEATRLKYRLDTIPSPHSLSLLRHDRTLQKHKRFAMKIFVNVLFTAAVATITGAVVGLKGRHKRESMEREAQEKLALAHKELRAIQQEDVTLCTAKDKEVEEAEKKVHFLADLLTALETDVQGIVVEAKRLRPKAKHVTRYFDAHTADAECVSGTHGDHGQPQAIEHAGGRKAQEKPGRVEGGADVTSEERSSPNNESALDGPVLKCPTAALEAKREMCSIATSGKRGTGLAVDEGNSTYKRGGRGGYRQARGAQRSQDRRGGRGEGVRGGRGRGSRGSRRSVRGVH